MKNNQITKVVLLTLFIMMIFSTVTAFTYEPQISLFVSSEERKIEVGNRIIAHVLIRNVPNVYSAEISISFDPDIITIIDTDQQANGIQVIPGDFFNLKQVSILKNQADNKEGTADYTVVSLGDTASCEQKDGLLAQIIFRAKKVGCGFLRIERRKLGIYKGQTIIPVIRIPDVAIEVVDTQIGNYSILSEWYDVIILATIGLVMILITMIMRKLNIRFNLIRTVC